ncbi:hypothetical protein DESC_920067 [Desulfosarcina cetonica]|nr:hypothetical protein DESC_920067 [Desulfosarcina cetonica]
MPQVLSHTGGARWTPGPKGKNQMSITNPHPMIMWMTISRFNPCPWISNGTAPWIQGPYNL